MVLDGEIDQARDLAQTGRQRPSNQTSTRWRARLRNSLDRSLGDDPACAEDDHTVRRPLHLAQDVGGEEHRGAGGPRLADQPDELVLHQGIQTAGGLVEDEQFHRPEEGEQECELAAIPGRELAGVAPQVELEALGELIAAPWGRIHPAAG